MIQGKRLGRPLLGKWHLCSVVVSVIGLSTLSADSSPREAPPTCQLHSIRKPWLHLCTSTTFNSALHSHLLWNILLKLHCDLSCPLVAPTKRGVPLPAFFFSSWFTILFPFFFISVFFFFEYWYKKKIPLFIFLFMSLCVSIPLLSCLSPSNKHLCRPPLPEPLSPSPQNSSGWPLS